MLNKIQKPASVMLPRYHVFYDATFRQCMFCLLISRHYVNGFLTIVATLCPCHLLLHLFHTCSAAQLVGFHAKSRFPYHYMIVEVVFSSLFCLPDPLNIEVFHASLLLELCKLQPGFLPQVVSCTFLYFVSTLMYKLGSLDCILWIAVPYSSLIQFWKEYLNYP